ncbi:hypothetical protein ABI59_21940 [Acidobacteria bacterium Mor1]|nr:hypothetical protein ABI59_21940 [Acidobacteria bacterium Mor1]
MPLKLLRKSKLQTLATLVCLGLALPAAAVEPGEVSGVTWVSKAWMEWQPEPGADSYTVYRGYLPDLGADYFGTFLIGERDYHNGFDPAEPVPDWGFFYLVTANNADGEGEMGSGNSGGTPTARPNNQPWPGLGVAGEWSDIRAWPDISIHSAVLHTGKLITWRGDESSYTTTSYVYDPATDSFTSQVAHMDLFCGGHTFLADGRLLGIGGTSDYDPYAGGKWSGIFDPVTETWTDGPDMADGRWYPTAVTMADETVLTFSGLDETTALNPKVERYDPATGSNGAWSVLPGANRTIEFYPRMHLMPDGTLVHVGIEAEASTFDPATETWTPLATSSYGVREEGTSVLLPPDNQRVMILGGGQEHHGDQNDHGDHGDHGGEHGSGGDTKQIATATAEIIDMAAETPAWSGTASMHFPRIHGNAVLLPDGTVLAAGGGYNHLTPTFPAEVFDPVSETWTVAASMHSFRRYHSSAVLLPDGRVFWGGSDENPTGEFYSPGYLFRGPRPTITTAPASVGYGQTFQVDTPDAAGIASVVFMRPGATTHSINMEQRHVPLSFTTGSGNVQPTTPSNPHLAPPGYYMMFLLDGDGVPSEARFVQLR